MSHITIAIETSNASSKHLRNLSNAAKPASSNRPRHSNRRNLQIRPSAWNTASTSYSTCGTVRNPICARVPPGTLLLRTSCQGLGPRTDSEPDSQNLLDKPRSPKKINLVSQDLQTPPLEKLSGSSGTRLLEPSETRTGTTPTATPKPLSLM